MQVCKRHPLKQRPSRTFEEHVSIPEDFPSVVRVRVRPDWLNESSEKEAVHREHLLLKVSENVLL